MIIRNATVRKLIKYFQIYKIKIISIMVYHGHNYPMLQKMMREKLLVMF
jgi:hypothetical protein